MIETFTKSTTITVKSLINNIEDVKPLLIDYCKLYSSLERKLFNYLKDKEPEKSDYNILQKQYIKDYNIHARIFKTLWKQVNGKISALKSNNKNYIINRENKIEELQKKLIKFKDKLSEEYVFNIKNKINRLTQLNKEEFKIESVWGSKTFYKKQWNAENHEEWLSGWKERRDNNIFSIGSSDETFGNSLFQLQILTNLRLTLPKSFSQKYLMLNVNFTYRKKRIKIY